VHSEFLGAGILAIGFCSPLFWRDQIDDALGQFVAPGVERREARLGQGPTIAEAWAIFSVAAVECGAPSSSIKS
jgi:hypothetical protein